MSFVSTSSSGFKNIFTDYVAGSRSFTVPAGITLLFVTLIGGGSGASGL